MSGRPDRRSGSEPPPPPETGALPRNDSRSRLPWWGDDLFLSAALAFVVLYQFLTPGVFSTDSFFHIRFADLLREHWVVRSLPSLPFSVHGAHYRDHHWLSHLLQVPFTVFPDLLTGAKVSAATFAALAHLAFYLVLRTLGVPSPGWWTALLAVCSPGFAVRMQMARVQSQSLAFLLGGLAFLELRHWRLLAVLAAFYVWLYDGFSVLLLMTALWCGAEWVRERRFPAGPALTVLAGTCFALVVNPYFPENLSSYAFNFQRVFLQRAPVMVGKEWGAPGGKEIALDAGVSLAVLGAALVAEALRRGWRGLARPPVLWALAALGFYLASRRWIEYLPPLCLLAAAVTLRSRPLPARALGAALLAVVLLTGSTLAAHLRDARPRDTFRGVSQWLKGHCREDEVVFNADWDRYPMLFFHNPQNRYVIGLDPNYLYYYDPSLYWAWRGVRDATSPHIGEAMARFGTRYLVASVRRAPVWNLAEAQGLALRYRDREARVYEFLPDTRRPPSRRGARLPSEGLPPVWTGP